MLAAIATELFIPESPVRTPGRVDVRGALVLAVGLAAPLLAISRANEWGWGDARTLGLFAFGLVVLAGWVVLQRRTKEPLVDIETLMKPPVLMTNIATLLVGFGMFGSFILIPQLVEAPESTGYGFGLTATGAGLLMLPGALVMLVAGPLSGVLGTRYGSRLPLAIGAATTSFGLLMMALMHGSQAEMVAWNLVMSIGIGLAFAAMPNLIVEAVPPEETGQATGVNTLVRSVGASLGSQVTRRRAGRQRGRRRAADRQRLHAGVPGRLRRRAARRDHRHADPQPQRPHGRSPTARHPGGLTMAVPAARTRADAVRNRALVIAAAAEVFAEKGEAARGAGDRRARRRRQGHGLPLLPDQGPPRRGRRDRARALVRARGSGGGPRPRPLGRVRRLHDPRRRGPLPRPRDGLLDVAGPGAPRARSRRAPTRTTRCAS